MLTGYSFFTQIKGAKNLCNPKIGEGHDFLSFVTLNVIYVLDIRPFIVL